MKVSLTIAGSDPTGGAGLQADIRTFSAFGVHGLSIPTALTVQNTEGVEAVEPIREEILRRQIEFLLSDIKPSSLKTGMLYTTYAVEAVRDAIERFSLKNLVVDPVTVSSSGKSLVGEGTPESIRKILFPISRVITPNIYEASLFTGIPIGTDSEIRDALRALKALGPEVVVITGGHLKDIAVDYYYDGENIYKFEGEKIEGEFHGTGCVFSASIAASLALGHSVFESVRRAKEFLKSAIKRAYSPGSGMRLLDIRHG